MEYAILEELTNRSEENRANYQAKYNKFFNSGLEKLNEPWTGSDNIEIYLYHNYFRENGPIDIIIAIRELDKGEKFGDFALKEVETAIYPVYAIKGDEAIDIPIAEPAPNLHPDVVKFILEKRALPKKKYNEEFDPKLHKWDINKIAQELGMSNRIVAKFCRAKNI